MRTRALLVSPFALLLVLAAAARGDAPKPTSRPAAAPTTKPLVTARPGDLPIILSAPHGGRLAVPGAEPRTGANVPLVNGEKRNFTTVWDGNVDQVAFALADEIERRTGHRPYVVVAHFGRRFVDANRPAAEAYESAAAKPVYDEYHAAVARYRDEINARWHRGLLLDIHGHGKDPAAIIRGTGNWLTDRHLVEEFGKPAVNGKDGLLGPLAAAGHTLVPPLGADDEKEYPALNGGHIVRTYGSGKGGAFDAVQLELGAKLRSKENIPGFAKDLADAVVPFMNRYLLGPNGTTRPAPAAKPASAP
ncbi:MAG TPA: hypothetical protein VF796_01730 [Humisphaera sp.]